MRTPLSEGRFALERRQKFCLALETGHSFRITRECIGKGLEGDLAVEINVVGQVDVTHAALARAPLMAERFADHSKLLLNIRQPARCNE